jgi:hypothetical protein
MTDTELQAIYLRSQMTFEVSGCMSHVFQQALADRTALLDEVLCLRAKNDALRAALDDQQQADRVHGGVGTVDLYAEIDRLRAWIGHCIDLGIRSHQTGTYESHALTLGMVMGSLANALEGRAAPETPPRTPG